jgi:hypothetical protein
VAGVAVGAVGAADGVGALLHLEPVCLLERLLLHLTTAVTTDTAPTLTTMDTAHPMQPTAVLMGTAEAVSSEGVGFGTASATGSGGACASATDQRVTTDVCLK